MTYICRDQLTSHEAEGRVGCELVETYICHIPRHPSGITVLSYDLYQKEIVVCLNSQVTEVRPVIRLRS